VHAVLIEGIHYIRPFGGRKLLFILEAIETNIGKFSMNRGPQVPMARWLSMPTRRRSLN